MKLLNLSHSKTPSQFCSFGRLVSPADQVKECRVLEQSFEINDTRMLNKLENSSLHRNQSISSGATSVPVQDTRGTLPPMPIFDNSFLVKFVFVDEFDRHLYVFDLAPGRAHETETTGAEFVPDFVQF